MANNRLYLLDRNTGERFYFLRSNAPEGWRPACSMDELATWLQGRDAQAANGDVGSRLEIETDYGIPEEYRRDEPEEESEEPRPRDPDECSHGVWDLFPGQKNEIRCHYCNKPNPIGAAR